MCLAPREDFPEIVNRGIIYLDNAASTLKPRQVIEAMARFSMNSYSNVHRGVYGLSIEASRAYEDSHEDVARFINGRWDEVIFVRNTSEAIQLAVLTLLFNKYIEKGDEIIATQADHHSLILPLARVARFVGARLRVIPVNSEGEPMWDLLPSIINRKTRIVAFSHKSNVTGYTSDARRIAKIAHEHGALVIVDGAQSVPHMKIDVKDLDVDFLAFSGHKMLGPTGIGVLWGRIDLLEKLEPPLGGGGTVRRVRLVDNDLEISWEEPPWRFEAGTPPIIEAIGMSEAVKYLEKIGMERIYEHEKILTEIAIGMLEDIGDPVRIVGPRDPVKRSGIATFSIRGASPETIGMWLDKRRIAVRTGLHCAHMLHDAMGYSNGSVRASFYIYNCEDDVKALGEAIEEYVKHNLGQRS